MSTQTSERHSLAAKVAAFAALGGIVLASLAVEIAAARGPSSLAPPLKHDMHGWLTGPFHGLWPGHYANPGPSMQPPLAGVIVVMLAFYVVALWFARRLGSRTVWTVLVVLHVIFLLGPPLLLTDVFNYSAYARMGVLHGLNPYTHLPVAIRHDFVYRLSNWHHLRDPYGPFFTLFTYALVPLGIVKSYWAYKIAVAAASLGTLALVGRCARLLGRPVVPALVLVGLNPLVLLYGLGGQHNDVFMLLPLFAAFAFALEGRDGWAGVLAVVAVFFKAPAILLLPVIVLAARSTRRAAIGAAVTGVLCTAVSLAAFGPHLPFLGGQTTLQTEWSIPNALGIALGMGGESAGLRIVLQSLLAAGAVACWIWAWRSKRLIEPAACLVALMIATISWSVPWYLMWLLPFIAFSPPRRVARPAIALVAWMTLQFMPTLPAMLDHSLKLQPWKTSVGKEAHARFERLVN